MPRFPTKPIPPRRLIFLATFVFAASVIGFVCLRGGWTAFVKIKPVLDASTPKVQNGFTLVRVEAADEPKHAAALVLWIRPPSFPKSNQPFQEQDGTLDYQLRGDPTAFIVQMTARMSSGDIAPLPWDLVGDAQGPQYLRVTVPGGYSNDCRYADITLVPASGPFPRWRIARLPYMRQVIPNNPTIVDHITVNGISVTAHAYRLRHVIHLRIIPILPAASHQWELATNNTWSQYEKFDRLPQSSPSTRMPIEGREGKLMPHDLAIGGSLTWTTPADYRSTSRFVRIDCTLRQFETLDERVTFRNVSVIKDTNNHLFPGDMQSYFLATSDPMTQKTPSGLAVTLPMQGTNAGANAGDGINVTISVRRLLSPAELPHSPLVRQFGKPVTVSMQFAPPDELTGTIQQVDEAGDTQTYSLNQPNPNWPVKPNSQRYLTPPPRRDFTVIVRQRVELQSIPMTFTVPVSDNPPPDFH